MAASLELTFPANLTPAEARAVEAYAKHGSAKGAGNSLGVTNRTIQSQLKAAREKAGASNITQVLLAYLKARPERWPDTVAGP